MNARRILFLSKHSVSGWALGGHPETSAHPDVEWTPFPAAIRIGPFRPIDGLVSEKCSWRVRPGPRAMVKLFLGCIQDCQPSVMAVRSRQSGGDTAGSRNREVLANEETGKVPGLFVQRFDYGIDG